MATDIQFPKTEPAKHPEYHMKALMWYGNQDVRVKDCPKPMITEPKDAIIRVAATTICGSDLHLYHHEFSGMEKGDILGHEAVGIVESIGPEVKNLKVGDRVVVSAVISCGECYYCKNGLFSCCDYTNPSKEMEKLYGHRTAGLFGYSHLTGGYAGSQAEFVRVPLADNNCLVIPQGVEDEKVLLLADVACTGWHANEMGGVEKGQTVAIWGCGPVGLMALMWAKFRGASKIIAIDDNPQRLELAKKNIGCEIINFRELDVLPTLQQLAPGGPDVCIDAVGFRFSKKILHKVQRALRIETDTPEILTECIMAVRKGGTVSVVGDYYATANAFPIGAFMEKGLTMRGGQVHIHKYWKELLGYITKGLVDPSFIITHHMSLEEASKAYSMFDKKEIVKVVLKP